MAGRVYLDHNASSPLRPAAAEAMSRAWAVGGNPSSVHAEGRAARALMEDAREAIAAAAGISPSGVVFTGGGTEANITALAPGRREGDDRPVTRLLASAIEHPCVLAGGRFAPEAVELIPALASGVIDLAALAARLEELARVSPRERALVSLQAANNETGIVQPIAEAARLAHAHGALAHCDAVQVFGKLPFDLSALGVDSAAVSAHKFGGPQGVGALLLANSAAAPPPLLRGGGQERGRRAGTQNVAAIAGLAAAARLACAELAAESERLAALRDDLEARLLELAPDLVIFGADQTRLPHVSLFALPGLPAETALMAFDLEGIAVSSGSACSSGKVGPSHVLAAMGVAPDMAKAAIRVSFGWSSQIEDVSRFAAAFEKLKSTIGHRQSRRAA